MLLPAYDAHGRLYYPQYESPSSSRTGELSSSTQRESSKPRKATTRSVSACIQDTFYVFSLQQKKRASMVVRHPCTSQLATASSALPTPALPPIPRWTGRSEGEKRGRSRNSVGQDIERSRSRDMVGLAPKPKESGFSARHHDSDETLVSVVEAPLMTPPPSLDPATASDYSVFTDIVTPDSAHGYDSRPPSVVPSSFKTAKQFFSSTNTSTASLLSTTAPSPKKKFCRSALFPPDGEAEYPVRGLCPNLQVLLMSEGNWTTVRRGSRGILSKSAEDRKVRAWAPAMSPPLAVISEHDPIATEIRSALESDISLELRKDTSCVALVHHVPSNPVFHASLHRPHRFVSYLSLSSSPAFKTFSNQPLVGSETRCECCEATNSWVKMSCVDDWIDAPYSIRQFRPPARRRADGSTLRKLCLEWQMVVHGKVDSVRHRQESKAPVQRQEESVKRGLERWGCGCVHHGFD